MNCLSMPFLVEHRVFTCSTYLPNFYIEALQKFGNCDPHFQFDSHIFFYVYVNSYYTIYLLNFIVDTNKCLRIMYMLMHFHVTMNYTFTLTTILVFLAQLS